MVSISACASAALPARNAGSVHWSGVVAVGLEWLARPHGTNWMRTNTTTAMSIAQSRILLQERPGRPVVLAMRRPSVRLRC